MLTFDRGNHVYRYAGNVVPSVTKVIPTPDFSMIKPDVLEKARLEGIDNHSKIKMFLDSGGETYGDEYLELFQEFFPRAEAILGKLTGYEIQLYHEELKFAGTPDLIFEGGLIDVKRSFAEERIHALQLAGYQLLVDSLRGKKTSTEPKNWIIAWREGNIFRHKNVWNPYAIDAFKMCLKKYRSDEFIKTYLKG